MKLITLFILFAALSAQAQLKLENARILTPLKGTNATAGYVTLKNDTDHEIEFSIKSAVGFKKVETHETIKENNRMKMQHVDSFKIAPHSSLVLEPGGRHIMLFDATKEFKAGDMVSVEYMLGSKLEHANFRVEDRSAALMHPRTHH